MPRNALAVFLAAALASAPAAANAPPRFPAGAVWNQDITSAPLYANSASQISTLAGLGGFGNGRMQIDFGMHIVNAPAGAPLRNIVGYPSAGEYYAPDCEAVGTAMPVPTSGAIESSTNLSCDNANEDCHLLVVQGNTLYEAYRANASGTSGLQSQCLAVWKLDGIYPASNRGDHCTSADAAGFPIAPLLFNADEVYAATQVANGDLGHAIRFILPNARMATENGKKVYVRPASHAGGPSGPAGTVAYGSRLRLRADFPVNLYNPAAQVILRTMQHYGIVLADGGTVALTAESDLFTTHRWTELGIDSRVFDQSVPGAPVRIQDFAVLDTGPRIVETYDCVRNPDPPPTGGGGELPTLSVADLSFAEGASGTTKKVSFKVTMSKPSTTVVRFNVATANGTAVAGSDYAAFSQVGKSIAAGATTATVAITVNGDASAEANETFMVNLSSPTGATIADGQAVGTILNDDDPVPRKLSIADVSIQEGASGTRSAVFKVSLDAPSLGIVKFSVATSDGTATAGSDYVAKSLVGQSIAAGQTIKNISVPVYGDALNEANETFSATLSAVSGAQVADGTATGTILNDDP
jgi:serine/threonine-protein kinase